MRMLILGAGYSGREIGQQALSRGFTVAGTTRSPEKAEALRAMGIEPVIYDGEVFPDRLLEAMADATHLVQSIAPGPDGDDCARQLEAGLITSMPNLVWAAYLSTVGVYGDHGGAWVDERTECRPVSARSVERVEAEDAWMRLAGAHGVPLAVLRLSGIYGPGRNAFVNLSQGTARRLVKPDQVFNRIRVEDIGSAALFLAERELGGIYNITDDEPCPPQDVVTEAARLMGIEPPPEQDFETAVLSPMARSFYGENKRVSNRKIHDLGFRFAFPEYRVSLAHLWQHNRWRG